MWSRVLCGAMLVYFFVSLSPFLPLHSPSPLPSLPSPFLPLTHSEINHYLLVAAGTTIHQVSLDVSYVADIVLPITGIINAVSVDVDIVQDMVYWSDDAASGIYRAPLTGGEGGEGGMYRAPLTGGEGRRLGCIGPP